MKICVTGGAGSIGTEVVARICGEHTVRVMDISEEGLWNTQAMFPGVDTVLGDVTSVLDCMKAAKDQDAVIHCAAVKHIDQCERSPEVARRVNVVGTMNMLGAAPNARFVFVSTDKAIDPVSVMGETKRWAELLVIERGGNVARFGNVLGTRGSLIPMVKRCAAMGTPITLTDPMMTRWMMTAREAVDVVIHAMTAEEESRVIGPQKLRSVRIGSFIAKCRDRYAPGQAIVRIATRPGERTHEPMELPSGQKVMSDNKKYLMSEYDTLFTEIETEAVRGSH